ncbi:MAG: CGNR zinc finger domain-containing protein, partial [Terriglobia bacterium]
LGTARRLRDAAQRLYDAQALDKEPDAADRKFLHARYAEALAGASLDDEGSVLEFSWPEVTKDLEYPLRPLAWAAMQLLLSEDRERIGRCQDDRGCGFLFIDTSKNHSRRWCSMEGCGNRAKAKRFYERRE